jgi:shikimate kinase
MTGTTDTTGVTTSAVVLTGPPGVGQSAVGPLVAARLGSTFRDTDADVETMAGKPVADIFIEDGEEAFRELERAVTLAALKLNEAVNGSVLALGSGAILDDQIRDALKARTVVYLAADFTTVAKHAGLDRPRIVLPGNPRGRLRAMLEERRPRYESVATITIQADDYDLEDLAAEIVARLQAGQAGHGGQAGQAGR